MTIFRPPEIPATLGVLDPAAVAVTGAPVSAHRLREYIRPSNLARAHGQRQLAWVTDIRDPGNEPTLGTASTYVPPYWQHVIMVPSTTTLKKFGLRSARLRLKAEITNTVRIEVFVATAENPNPNTQPFAAANRFIVSGTGAVATYDLDGIRLQNQRHELIGIYVRHRVAPATDPLMDVNTYGTPNAGTMTLHGFQAGLDRFPLGPVPTWNAALADDGHYVFFPNTNNVRRAPAFIEEVDLSRSVNLPPNIITTLPILYIFPETVFPMKAEFEIRKSPLFVLKSLEVRANDGSPIL